MSKFDPLRAVLEDEASDPDMEDFLQTIDKKAKTFRAQVIGDAFRELAKTAKEERGKLLDAAATKFAAEATKDRNSTVEVFNKRVLASQARFETRIDKLLEAQQSLEKLVKGIESRKPEPSGPSEKDISAAVEVAMKTLSDELKAMTKQRKDEHDELLTALAAIEESAAKEKNKTDKWKFTADRDVYGRIDLERGVIATRIK